MNLTKKHELVYITIPPRDEESPQPQSVSSFQVNSTIQATSLQPNTSGRSPYLAYSTKKSSPRSPYPRENADFEDEESRPLMYNPSETSTEDEIFSTAGTDEELALGSNLSLVHLDLDEISCFGSVAAYLLAFNMFVLVGAGIM